MLLLVVVVVLLLVFARRALHISDSELSLLVWTSVQQYSGVKHFLLPGVAVLCSTCILFIDFTRRDSEVRT